MNDEPTPEVRGTPPRRVAVARVVVLLLVVAAGVWVATTHGLPTPSEVRSLVGAAGPWAPALYVLVFASLTLVAAPRNVLTTVGAALFGVVAGMALSWFAAMLGAAAGFGIGRALGADVVARLTRGRLDRVRVALGERGTESVVAARLVPVVPFTAVNYGAGVLGIRLSHFTLGTAVGIVPGTIAYAALGAYAFDAPWALGAVGTALLALALGGVAVRRVRDARRPERRRPAPESADAAL